MFEIKKSGYVIQSNNHELPESVLKLFPDSVYSIILPQTRYFTCKYYKYMTDPFTEQYMYNQVINGNILAWGLRTIATDPSGNNITQKKKQYIGVCFKNIKVNPLHTTYHNLTEESLDVPLNFFIIRKLILNVNTFQVTCVFCKKYVLQMKMNFYDTKVKNILNNTVCSNSMCENSRLDYTKLQLDLGEVLISYSELPDYYNPNLRYYCNICFRCKVCAKKKLIDVTAFCNKHITCKHRIEDRNKRKYSEEIANSKKLKSLKSFLN